MTIRLRTIFFIIVGFLVFALLYIEREILSPFILAIIFAYVFNPVINFFTHKIRLPRLVSTLIVYLIIISIIVFSGIVLTRRVLEESSDLTKSIDNFLQVAKNQVQNLPDWMKPAIDETLVSLEKSKLFSTPALLSLFPQAISRIVSFVIFLFSGFYFLKEGRNMFDKLLVFVPNDYRIEVDILTRKINSVLSSYLRGQFFIVFLISLTLFLALSILGMRFALIIAIFSGFAEIVPFIGPIIAGSVAAIVMLLTGTNNFGLVVENKPFEGLWVPSEPRTPSPRWQCRRRSCYLLRATAGR